MNKARIEELVESCSAVIIDDRIAAIRSALITLAEECYEKAAKKCEVRAEERFGELGIREGDTGATYYPDAIAGACEDKDDEDEACAAAIRSLKDGLK